MDAVYDAILGGSTIRQVNSTQYQAQNTIRAITVSGGADPVQLSLKDSGPIANIQSYDLAGCLGAVDVFNGLNVAAGTITIPWNKHAGGGTFQAGGSHFTLSGTDAFTVIESIEDSQEADAAAVNMVTRFKAPDGLTNPVTANVNQSLAAAAVNAEWKMTKVVINGSTVLSLVGGTVNTGLEIVPYPFVGLSFPQEFTIRTRTPFIDLQFFDHDVMAAHGPIFSTITSLVLYFRQRAPGAAFTAPASLAHCSVTFADGIGDVQDISGQKGSNSSNTLRVYGETLTSATGIAIP